MSLNVLFQMDPIEDVDINADSSFRIAEEAQKRGHRISTYTPDKLAFDEGRVTAAASMVRWRRDRSRNDRATAREEPSVGCPRRPRAEGRSADALRSPVPRVARNSRRFPSPLAIDTVW